MKMYNYQIIYIDSDGVRKGVNGKGYFLPELGDLIAIDKNSYKVVKRVHNYQTGDVAVIAIYSTDMENY